MKNQTMIVEIRARMEWLEPPKNKDEEIFREVVNVMTGQAGKQLEVAVKLLIAELLNAQVSEPIIP